LLTLLHHNQFTHLLQQSHQLSQALIFQSTQDVYKLDHCFFQHYYTKAYVACSVYPRLGFCEEELTEPLTPAFEMSTCSFCRKPTSGPPGYKEEWSPCLFCEDGVTRHNCTYCTWYNGNRVKCCLGRCVKGKAKCTQSGCEGGKRLVKNVCNKPHNVTASKKAAPKKR
jgi:hypothetical protein